MIIDTDRTSSPPKHWSIRKVNTIVHKSHGQLDWGSAKTSLYRAQEHHRREDWITKDVSKHAANQERFLVDIAGMSVLNATVMDNLLRNQKRIPEG